MPMIIKKDWLTIGEVSELTSVPIHTLRYWESEFDGYFSPLRTSGRQRRYDERAVDRVLEIKTLLKEEKYSIAGARQVLSRKMEMSQDMGEDFAEAQPPLRVENLPALGAGAGGGAIGAFNCEQFPATATPPSAASPLAG